MRKVKLSELKELALHAKPSLQEDAGNYDRSIKVYLHWSAGHYDQLFDDYHINIAKDGTVYVSSDDLSVVRQHTYGRNVGAVSIAAACAYDAKSLDDLGVEPPTEEQVEVMAKVMAVLADAFEIPIDIRHIMTHAEAADNMDADVRWHDAYGPHATCEHWDLWIIKAGDAPGSGGKMLRSKGLWYQRKDNK